MPKGYWIVRVDITDMEQYKAYVAANAEPLKRYGGRFLVRAGRFENPEGASRTRNAVIEFPSYQAAVDCWKSPEYQQAIKLRQPVSTADLIIIEGYDGPQPACAGGYRLTISIRGRLHGGDNGETLQTPRIWARAAPSGEK
jgi:uncharacterized protein (DUF1330 family)